MSSPDEASATTLVIEMKPGWIYVKLAEPKPDPQRIELLLRLTIDQWFNTYPQYVIDKTQSVTDHGTLQGVHVWYHVDDRQSRPVNPELPKQPISLTVQVSNQVLQQVPKEHIEAVVDEAMQIWRSHQDCHGTVVVINPQGIAVILEKQINRGAVLPVELVYPALEETTRRRVQTWLEAPPTRRHVILIDGSWFMPQKTESARDKIREPDSRHTNITYDAGSRPQNWEGGGGYAG